MMKRLLSLTAALFLTLPLHAEEKAPEKQEKQEKKETEDKAESPLVAAAKRARRGKSTTVVITDDMVKSSTGHLTTTKVDYMPRPLPPAPQTSEMKMLEDRAKQRAEDAKKAEEAKKAEAKKQEELIRRARLAEAAENYEDGYDEEGVDPAMLEKQLAEEAAKEQKKP